MRCVTAHHAATPRHATAISGLKDGGVSRVVSECGGMADRPNRVRHFTMGPRRPRPEGPNVGVPAPGHDEAARVRASPASRAVHDTPDEADVSEHQMPICLQVQVT